MDELHHMYEDGQTGSDPDAHRTSAEKEEPRRQPGDAWASAAPIWTEIKV